eukprot:CAMPEP_0195611206 /NCGR_PEP_ID=MMETSP0815-20121206/10218_1 /TAXON_ID=97485 /ORGANISM="Prymnesium parvum, Strain Texoma1" /LENGTH=199 /DNA_ID=CAMNT_0040751245 /DNA_START=201 /DNA_END=796 /DNA_ORIENTATION=-
MAHLLEGCHDAFQQVVWLQFSSPRRRITNGALHLALRKRNDSMMHSRQKECWHGSECGASNRSMQIGHFNSSPRGLKSGGSAGGRVAREGHAPSSGEAAAGRGAGWALRVQVNVQLRLGGERLAARRTLDARRISPGGRGRAAALQVVVDQQPMHVPAAARALHEVRVRRALPLRAQHLRREGTAATFLPAASLPPPAA